MKGLLIVVFAICGLQGAMAGRAFPVAAENFATTLFQKINPILEWDPTNFLVDLSGRFALCKNIGRRGGLRVEERTPDDVAIGGLIDTANGAETHAPAVVQYVQQVLPAWIREEQFANQIKRSEKFGCSVQPGCATGQMSIVCLFSPELSGEGPPPLKQIAQAFTRKQYGTASLITGVAWDQSHFLENLSGYETDCAMVTQFDWQFNRAKGMVDDPDAIQGLMGKSRNRGSTPVALRQILKRFKQLPFSSVGCSLIPDCMVDGQMWVVISCIYSN